MARITSITISRSARINLGNYEGLEHFVSMTQEVLEGETLDSQSLAKKVERSLCEQLFRSFRVRGKKMTRAHIARHFGLEEPVVKTKAPPKEV